MKKKELFALLTAGALLLSGCGGSASESGEGQSGSDTDAASQSYTEIEETDASEMFSDRDKEVGYDETESVSIQLSDDNSACESDAVEISGNTVTIKEEGTYVLSGTLTDGMVMVAAEDTDKIHLVLDNVSISNSQSAALYIASADKVFLTTKSDTENTLENGGSYTQIDDNNIDAAVFSKSDLTLNGEGTLTVTAEAGHGIVSKDDLVFTSGAYEITGADHGISGKDSVRIANGTYTIISGNDGIHAENADDASLGFVYLEDGTFEITASGDGISAGSWLQAEDGTYRITAGEGSGSVSAQDAGELMMGERQEASAASSEDTVSTKGLKAVTQMLLKAGDYTVDSEDDALHSNGDLTVSGGAYLLSSGDDGIHADSGVEISGGSVDITKSYEGIEGLRIDITGGEISLTASDDGLNAAGGNDGSGFEGMGPGGDQFAATEGAYIAISGGTLWINAYGDGIDSNGDFTVSGGETYVSGPVNSGNGTLDYNGEASITGGIFAASGAAGMEQNFGSSSTQGVMMVNLGAQAGGAQITLTDGNGTELLSWTAEKEFASVIVSCPEIQEGGTYTLAAGTREESVTMNSLVYGSGSQQGGGKSWRVR